jgi:short-subunit dehydrogenase
VAETAVVTGASGGVGGAISLALARPGVRLTLSGRHRERLEAVAEESRRRGAQVRIHCADLCQDQAVAQLVEQVEETGGKLDILVHSMGIIQLGSLESSPVASLEAQFRANVRAPYVLTQALLPALRAGCGQVAFINSTAGLNAAAGVSQYAASKHALRALADSLREEVNPDGIRVLSVFLGRTATPMQEAVHRSEGRPYDPSRLIQPEDVAATVVQALRLPRSVELTEFRIRPEKKPL